jgi:hypothetical protein
VVVDHGRRAVADTFNERDLRRKRDVFLSEGAIHLPPQALEDFHKVGSGFARDRHAARHGRVEMVMGADEARQNNLTGAIDGLGIWEAPLHFRGIPNCQDVFAFCDDRAVPNYLIVLPQGHHNSVLKPSCHSQSFRVGVC